MEPAALLQLANQSALELIDRLKAHTEDEKRLIALGYMCGFCEGNLVNGQGRNPEQSGENTRT
jgi:hypothetical protein